jgi:hypothetical protein
MAKEEDVLPISVDGGGGGGDHHYNNMNST